MERHTRATVGVKSTSVFAKRAPTTTSEVHSVKFQEHSHVTMLIRTNKVGRVMVKHYGASNLLLSSSSLHEKLQHVLVGPRTAGTAASDEEQTELFASLIMLVM